MKRSFIGALVGAIIIFIWQFLSFAALNLHGANHKYTPNQDAILNAVTSNITEEGGYIIPNLAPDKQTSEDHEKFMADQNGKPSVHVLYHKSMEYNMTMNMVRGFLSNVIMLLLFCWILGKINMPSFATVFLISLALGLIIFINQPYTGHIWFQFFDIKAYLLDCILSWGVCGLWLGWWFTRRRVA
jgi:hypothetical protein